MSCFLLIRLIILMKGWLTEEDMCCIHIRERFHSCWRLPEHNSYIRTAVCFPLWRMLRTNISSSWLQGCCWFRGRNISQNTLFQSNKPLVLIVLCCVRCRIMTSNGKCLLNCFTSEFNLALYTRFNSLSQASAGSEFIKQQGPQQKSDEPNHVQCSRPFCCTRAAPHTWVLSMLMFACIILGILSVTVHIFHVSETHRWFPLSIHCGQLVLADAVHNFCLIAFLLRCVNTHRSCRTSCPIIVTRNVMQTSSHRKCKHNVITKTRIL